MQNGGFVNKIQGVRLSVAKIHRHVFENPGYMLERSFDMLFFQGTLTAFVYIKFSTYIFYRNYGYIQCYAHTDFAYRWGH